MYNNDVRGKLRSGVKIDKDLKGTSVSKGQLTFDRRFGKRVSVEKMASGTRSDETSSVLSAQEQKELKDIKCDIIDIVKKYR